MGQVRDTIGQLLTTASPVTFLDALRLVRRAKNIDSNDLDALVQLHDHASTTDGAKEVLNDFLRGKAQSMAYERRQSERILTMTDSGKTVRAAKGSKLIVLLETRAHRGGDWQPRSISDNLTWTVIGMDKERRYTNGEITLEALGHANIELFERLSPPKRSTAKSQMHTDEDRVFTLEIIVEP